MDNLAYLSEGKLPIRVLKNRLSLSFEKVFKGFRNESIQEIKYNNLNSELLYDVTEERITYQAQIIDGQIKVSESFMGFLWCLIYYTIVLADLQEKSIDSPEIYSASNKDYVIANDLIEYGLSLFQEWRPWDVNLPNPEVSNVHDNYSELTTYIFLHAMNFIHAHEYSHNYLGHLEGVVEIIEIKEQELAADLNATQIISLGALENEEASFPIKAGCLIGLMSVLFFDKSLDGGDEHPDIDERIDRMLSTFNAEPNDYIWFVATIIYSIWIHRFQLKINFPENYSTYKEQYTKLLHEVRLLKIY